jgi:hypothetical protein
MSASRHNMPYSHSYAPVVVGGSFDFHQNLALLGSGDRYFLDLNGVVDLARFAWKNLRTGPREGG